MTKDRKIGLLTGLMMSGAMSLALSGLFTALAVGLGPQWPGAWGRSFLLGWPIAFALAVVLAGPPCGSLPDALRGGEAACAAAPQHPCSGFLFGCAS